MEDTFLDGIFLGMRLRSDEILIGTTRGVIKTRTVRRRVEEEQWDPEFAKSIKGEPRQPCRKRRHLMPTRQSPSPREHHQSGIAAANDTLFVGTKRIDHSM